MSSQQVRHEMRTHQSAIIPVYYARGRKLTPRNGQRGRVDGHARFEHESRIVVLEQLVEDD